MTKAYSMDLRDGAVGEGRERPAGRGGAGCRAVERGEVVASAQAHGQRRARKGRRPCPAQDPEGARGLVAGADQRALLPARAGGRTGEPRSRGGLPHGLEGGAPRRLVFIDETWAKTNMTALRGWSPKGRRLIGRAPHGHWRMMTFIAALRHDRIGAPFVLDGPVNGEAFRAYVEHMLVPTLSPGDVVVIDNLGSHKGQAVRDAIRAAKAHLLFLPPYSPDPNPIEQVFAKLKHMLRDAAERTIEATWRRIGTSLDRFTPQECANYLANAGYASV